MRAIRVFGLCVLLAGTICGYQIKPRNYNKIVQQQKRFNERFTEEFMAEHLHYAETGNKSTRLEELFDHIRQTPEMFRQELGRMPMASQGIECTACGALASLFLRYRQTFKWDRERLINQAVTICRSLEVVRPDSCVKLVDINIDVILYILDNTRGLTAPTICGVLFQSGACTLEDPKFLDWSVDIAPGGTPVTSSKTGSNRGENDLKIIHITDLHYDPSYQTGYSAVCGEPICCRRDQGIPEEPVDGAGEWGDYRDCSSPWKAVENAIREAERQHPDADVVYHTGDIVDHGIWDKTVSGNIDSMNRVYSLLKEVFQNRTIFNVLGNHDITPVNAFAPSYINQTDLSSSWLYELAADLWADWLSPATRQTILSGGYYTSLVRPGFRVIGLNNNDVNTFNWWLLHDPTYPKHQLQWLHDTLLQAEAAGEKVHILGHLPIVYETSYNTWSRQYRRILERYWDTITAQFYGHTHADEFNVFYSISNPQHTIGVGFNGGGTVPYSNYNPNYVVYYVNPDTYEVTDIESFYYDLAEANLHPQREPQWKTLYSFSRDFAIVNVSPSSLDSLVHRFAANSSELRRYWELKVKRGEPFLEEGCDGECLLNHLCEVVNNDIGDDRKCDQLRAIAASVEFE
uniref:sphingomyelin phosphodiesterase-like n=1 Tax=Toxorhynchites rutilus septentrionalis TaxID=329112 RepID=UPI00247ACC10|nr:sphingomyelin phosphodiesterase-like [Toxorhynchites rutilus septentrionalis]